MQEIYVHNESPEGKMIFFLFSLPSSTALKCTILFAKETLPSSSVGIWRSKQKAKNLKLFPSCSTIANSMSDSHSSAAALD